MRILAIALIVAGSFQLGWVIADQVRKASAAAKPRAECQSEARNPEFNSATTDGSKCVRV